MNGKVAEILDCYTVAINRGEEHDVWPGDYFAVGRDVIDPDTGESLGWHEKLRLKVKDSYPKFCVAETIGRVKAESALVTVNVGDEVQRVFVYE